MSRRISLLLIASLLLAPAWGASAQDEAAKKAPATTKPATIEVKAAPFQIEVKLSGVFESAGMTEISFKAKTAASLTVLKSVEHGTAVAKGDTLVAPMLDKFDKALKAKQHADATGALALHQAEAEFSQLKASTPLKLAAAARAAKRAQEDLDHFEKNRKLTETAARETHQTALDRLAYIKEELRQLKKMYEADDLTEETEEIVLRRTQDSVRRAELAVKHAKVTLDTTLNTTIPRQAKDKTLAARAAVTANEDAKVILPMALEKGALDIAASRRDRKKARDALADLKADREAMTIKAPVAGVVYYGKCNRGKWSSTAVAAKLVRNGKLAADEVFMAIVDPKSLFIRVSVAEKDLGLIAAGQGGLAIPTAYPQKKLAVKLDKFSTIPMASGQFDARLALPDGAGPVTAGMTCSITLLAHENLKALGVPVTAVFKDAGKEFVYVKQGDAKKKRPVVTGKSHGGKIEILKGLAAGETIFRKASK